MAKNRLDVTLVEKGLVKSRNLAQRMIMAGQVRVNGQVQFKPSAKIDDRSTIDIDPGPRYVSRGGEKLAAAVEAFSPEIKDRVCADVGASTGGFTDCLLQNGAARVYAIDVGHGILDWRLRNNSRVVVLEKTNARHLESLPEPVDLVTIDVSFISLKLILPVVTEWFGSPQISIQSSRSEENSSDNDFRGQAIALIKPQFEAGRKEVQRGKGVIKDPEIHRQVLVDVLTFAEEGGFGIQGLIRSPIKGPKGNTEFLAYFAFQEPSSLDIELTLNDVFGEQ